MSIVRGCAWRDGTCLTILAQLAPLHGTAVRAEETAAPVASSLALDEAKAAPWQLSMTPYVWATELKGAVGVGSAIARVDTKLQRHSEEPQRCC